MQLLFFTVLALIFTGNNSGKPLPCVEVNTELGKIILEIDTVNAPVTSENFLFHVKNGTYQDAVFYRVVTPENQLNNDIKIEVIQGGLFYDCEIEKHSAIRHETTKETGLKHLNGTLSMARAEPGTASTEFFICIGEQPELDFGGHRNSDRQGFAAFGKVISGMDVVNKIQRQPDEMQYLTEPVKILDIRFKEK